MAAYVVRRFFQGLVVLVLSTFLVYSILIITPGGPRDQINALKAARNPPVNPDLIKILERQYGLDKPYPLSYFLWLFDPDDTIKKTYTLQGELHTAPKGINFLGIIRGSGILTGDMGESISIDQGKSVATLMGDRLG